MKKLLILTMLIPLLLTADEDRKLAVVVSKANWDAIPAAKKQQGRAILEKCTSAPVAIRFYWELRAKANTNNIFGYAVFSGDAWVLKQKEKLDNAKIQQFKDALESYGVTIRWTTNFWQDVDAAGLEPIPRELPK